FRRLERALADAGFDKDPGPPDEADNRTYTSMTGKVAADTARRLTQIHHVLGVVLYPDNWNLPPQDTPVKVALDLRWAVSPRRPPQAAERFVAAVRDVGFSEAVGYDHRDHTRVVGTVPAGKVEELVKGPQPWPVHVVEVKSEDAGAPYVPPAAPPKEQAH